MEVLYEYFSIFFFVRAFLTFLCMDMGGQQFFSALEMRWMMVDGAGAFCPMHWGVPRWND
jgi:hypothetical protein